jgi:hypothetical protein
MSASFIVPFNQQPVSTSVKTTSYTIPAGKYARVTGKITSDNSFSTATGTLGFLAIDGSPVQYVNNYGINRVWSTGLTNFFTIPTQSSGNMTYWIQNTGAGATAFTINGVFSISLAAGATSTGSFNVTPGDQLNFSVAQTGRFYGAVIGNKSIDISLWVPAGTVLTGSVLPIWVVEEYNMIS